MTDMRQPHEQQPPWQPYQGGSQPANFTGSGYQTPAGMPPGGSYAASGSQLAPPPGWSHQRHGTRNAEPPPEPKNGLAMPALILGIITLGLSPLPFLNQAGILVGLVGVGLGIAALVVGLGRRARVAMAAFALALSVLGLISEVVPGLVEVEVAVPHLMPAVG